MGNFRDYSIIIINFLNESNKILIQIFYRGISNFSLLSLLNIYLILTSRIFSQEIIFCKGVTDSGIPLEIISRKVIEINDKIYILIKKEKDILLTEGLLVVEKIEKNFKENLFSIPVKFSDGNNWEVYEYHFTKSGLYSFRFFNQNSDQISAVSLLVEKKEDKNLVAISDYELFPELMIIFCKKVVNNKPEGILEKISIKNKEEVFFIYISNNRPLNTELIKLRVWRKKFLHSPYEIFIDSRKYRIKPSWYDTYIKYSLEKPGHYKFDFFNDKDLLLKTAYITVDN